MTAPVLIARTLPAGLFKSARLTPQVLAQLEASDLPMELLMMRPHVTVQRSFVNQMVRAAIGELGVGFPDLDRMVMSIEAVIHPIEPAASQTDICKFSPITGQRLFTTLRRNTLDLIVRALRHCEQDKKRDCLQCLDVSTKCFLVSRIPWERSYQWFLHVVVDSFTPFSAFGSAPFRVLLAVITTSSTCLDMFLDWLVDTRFHTLFSFAATTSSTYTPDTNLRIIITDDRMTG
jgi:hypothetical protein